MEAMVAKERGITSREEIITELKILLEKLKKQTHHPLLVKTFHFLFPEEEKEKIPRFEPLEREDVTIGILKEIKKLKEEIEKTLQEISEIFDRENLTWLNSNFRRALREEWAFSKEIIKQIENLLIDLQKI